MAPRVVIIPDRITRIGFRLESPVVRAVIPAERAGTYCLVHEHEPTYIGRSDRCVRTRLVSHARRHAATHFFWEPASSRWSGFCLEAFWWHRLAHYPAMTNHIHPAVPAGLKRHCPFCERRDTRALGQILPWVHPENRDRTTMTHSNAHRDRRAPTPTVANDKGDRQ